MGCVSGATPTARHAVDRLDRNVEEMAGDGSVAGAKNGASVVDALLDQVDVPDGVLTDGPVHDVGLGRVDEGGKVADALLGLLGDFDGCLAAHVRYSSAFSIEVPKYLVTRRRRVLVGRGELLRAQQRLGHRDPSTTLRNYAHALPLEDETVADDIDDMLGAGSTIGRPG